MFTRKPLLLAIAAVFFLSAPAWSDTQAQAPHWVPGWYASPVPNGKPEAKVDNQTLRQIVRVSSGASTVRIRLSNAYGTEPLHIDAVSVARRVSGSRIDVSSNTPATFNAKTGVTIAPGAYVLSDPLPVEVKADSDLAISLFVATPTKISTVHDIQRSAIYATSGNALNAEALPEKPANLGTGSPWLAEVSVLTEPVTRAIVAFGDSITDGYGVTADKGGTWPEVLSRRLHDAGINISVVNAGISGNRLLHHGQYAGFGDAALARFDRDVLAQPNVSDVIVLIGINDLGHAQGPGSPEYVSADDVIDAYTQLAMRAHERGLRIHAGTLLPFKDTVFPGYYSDEKEARRVTINKWIRSNAVFDSVIDFDAATEDPKKPGFLRKELDAGDHLHPNIKGAAVMGNAVPLEIFAPDKALRTTERLN
jgi:lysophospholipase L1-like esterase